MVFVLWSELDPGLRRGTGSLGILLAGVMDGQHLYGVRSDAIDENIVGMDDRFPRARDATGPVHIGMIGQAIGRLAYDSANSLGGGWIVRFNIVDDIFEFSQRAGLPDDRQH